MWFVIHRNCDKDREQLVKNLQAVLNCTVFEGIDGTTLQHPNKHPWEGTTTAGNLGNTVSHVTILQQAIKNQMETVGILEDDAVIEGNIISFINTVPQDWDMLYLGTNEIVNGFLLENCYRVYRAWGSHAVLLKPKAMNAVLATYEQSLRDGIGLPADWLYNRAIQLFDLKAYCPIINLIEQKKGLVSLATGNIRS